MAGVQFQLRGQLGVLKKESNTLRLHPAPHLVCDLVGDDRHPGLEAVHPGDGTRPRLRHGRPFLPGLATRANWRFLAGTGNFGNHWQGGVRGALSCPRVLLGRRNDAAPDGHLPEVARRRARCGGSLGLCKRGEQLSNDAISKSRKVKTGGKRLFRKSPFGSDGFVEGRWSVLSKYAAKWTCLVDICLKFTLKLEKLMDDNDDSTDFGSIAAESPSNAFRS